MFVFVFSGFVVLRPDLGIPVWDSKEEWGVDFLFFIFSCTLGLTSTLSGLPLLLASALLGLQFRLGDKPVEFQVACPPNGIAAPKELTSFFYNKAVEATLCC